MGTIEFDNQGDFPFVSFVKIFVNFVVKRFYHKVHKGLHKGHKGQLATSRSPIPFKNERKGSRIAATRNRKGSSITATRNRSKS